MWPSPALLCFAGVAVLVMCSSKLDHMTSYFAHIRKSCRLRASFLLISGHVMNKGANWCKHRSLLHYDIGVIRN